jgi:hypothetical protein
MFIDPWSFCISGIREAALDAELLVLYQGRTKQLAEKLIFLKGTAFRPYITAV